MYKPLNFWLIGGDHRQAALAHALAEDGHSVHTYALEEGVDPAWVQSSLTGAETAHCVILPLPAANGDLLNAPLSTHCPPLSQVLDALSPQQLICAGMVTPALTQAAANRNLTLTDYFAREELAVANAVPSSEGAIQIAMEELPITLQDARVLVIGYGRLGKVLAQQLHGLGARVTVAARNPADRAWVRAWGYGDVPSDHLARHTGGFDLICNTVPVCLLDREALSGVTPGCLIIDLASKPGGVDFAAAGELGIKVIWALSLPGKVAPVTAGKAIRSAIYNIMTELGV